MSGMKLGGLVSGMDTSSLIRQLMEIERQPVYNKEQEVNRLESNKKIWEEVNSKLSALDRNISALKRTATFNSKSTEVSNESVVTATAMTSAARQNYRLTDVVLATPGRTTSSEAMNISDGVKANVAGNSSVEDGNQKFDTGTGVIRGSFKLNGISISVNEDDTIRTVINKINVSPANVKATFDETTNEFKLEQKTAGSARRIEIGAEDTSGFLDAMGLGGQLGTRIENGVNPDHTRAFSEINGAGESFEGLTSGFFTINDYTFEIDASTDSLSTVISRINSSDAGVTAFFDPDTKQVTLTSEEAGGDLELKNDTSGFLKAINVLGEGEESASYEGTGASFKLNGIEFQKSTNSFEINGVNYTLRSETAPGEVVNISVGTDTDRAFNAIKDFINEYNGVVEYLSNQTAVEKPLQGDSMANSLIRRLRANMTNKVEGVESKFSQLALIGIESNSSGSTLTINDNALKAALEENSAEVQKLFANKKGVGRINNEQVAGAGTDYQLAETPSNIDEMEIRVGGVTYSMSNSVNKIITSGEPEPNEVFVDSITGEIKFGTEPTDDVFVDYDYIDEDYAGGIAYRTEAYLRPLTRYSGVLDSQIKSIDNNIRGSRDWMASFEDRLAIREQSLLAQFTAMERAMSQANSQSQWLNAQLAGMQ